MNGNEASWLADGVKEIERLARSSINLEPKIVKLDQEKPGTYAIVKANGSGGTLETRVAGPKWHNEVLETPGQLNAFIRSIDDLRPDAKAEPSAVYVSQEKAVFVYSFEDRRDRATCPLIISKPFNWLMQPAKPMDQRSLIRLLRITFADCLPAESNLVSLLRSLRFTNNGEVQTDIQRGREALGKQILNEVRGVDVLPDEIVLNVPVFENFKTIVSIRCVIEINPDVGSFELIALPSQLNRGMQLALDQVAESAVESTDVKAFIGSVRDQIEN